MPRGRVSSTHRQYMSVIPGQLQRRQLHDGCANQVRDLV